MKISVEEMRGLIRGQCLPADMFTGEYLPEYLVRKFTELHQRLDATLPEVKWHTGLPSVAEGSNERFWVTYRLKDGSLHVTDLIFFNCPAPENEDEFCDAEMTSPDGDPYWPEGWHDLCSHPDFDYFYNKSDLEVLAYAEFVKPEASEITADADKAGEQ